DEGPVNTFKVRIFTPNEEVPFAGHPTLGTAYIIITELLKGNPESVVLDLKAGKITVRAYYDGAGKIEKLVMEQLEPSFGPVMEKSLAAKILGISASEIEDNFPVQEVSTGLPVIIAPLKTLESVRRVRVDSGLFYKQFESFDSRGILVFSPEAYRRENSLNVRAFFHHYGIPEDPATGSANGCLAGYLLKYRYFNKNSLDIKVEQGFEIGRKSILYLSGSLEGDKINIFVGGRVIPVARCELV
ncbi:MAG: PhzF family phenazine biosynthesis protein, partial [Desulfocucumaceae bacterium]